MNPHPHPHPLTSATSTEPTPPDTRYGRARLRFGLPVLPVLPVLAVLPVLVGVVVLAGPVAGVAVAEPVHPAVTDAAGDLPAQVWVVALAPSVGAVLDNVRNWIMGVAAGLATVFFTVGAVRYMTAGGDLGAVEKAKSALRSAALGYALALLTPLALTVLRQIVGAD